MLSRFLPGRKSALLVVLLVVLLLSLLGSACGVKSPPRPLADRVPAPRGLKLNQQGDQLLISWNAPSTAPETEEDTSLNNEAPAGYQLLITRLQLICPRCAPVSRQRVTLNSTEARRASHGSRIWYAHPLPKKQALWSVRLAARYLEGQTFYSDPQLLDTPISLPTPALNGFRQPQAGRYQIHWPAYAAGVLYPLTPEGPQPRRQLWYRMNIYQRLRDEPWPLRPANPLPLTETTWEVALLPSLNPEAIEVQGRLVDRHGNESHASVPLLIGSLPAPARPPQDVTIDEERP